MAAIAPIIANDGASTPVAHTFNPVQSAPYALWRDTVASLPLVGQATIMLRLQQDAGNGLNKIRLVLKSPVVETIGTVGANGYVAGPKVAFVNTVNTDFILPSRGTNQNRKDVLALYTNAFFSTQLTDAVISLSQPY